MNLFDTLQAEFCPPLDTSLLAALLADYSNSTPTSTELTNLRASLTQLAQQAQVDEESLFYDLSDSTRKTDTGSDYNLDTNTTTATSTDDVTVNFGAFSSPLGFLQAALPDVPLETLTDALRDAKMAHDTEDDIDMWDVIASILSRESIREMEERGISDVDDDDSVPPDEEDDIGAWETIDKPTKKPANNLKTPKAGKRKTNNRKPTKITLADVRQQHHHHRHSASSKGPAPSDPWTHLTSLSTHLASLLPPHPPSFFLSYFHSPQYATPGEAMRAALGGVVASNSKTSGDVDEHGDTTVLFNLLDIILASDDEYEHTRLISDAQLAVDAACACTLSSNEDAASKALDIVTLLRELDTGLDLGVYHTPTPTPTPVSASAKPQIQLLPSMPPPIPPPPSSPTLNLTPTKKNTSANANAWHHVPHRRATASALARGHYNLHAGHIPAYKRDVNSMKTCAAASYGGSRGTGHHSNIEAYKRKRDSLLREATRMWQRGNSKTRGGEVAFYFAERAREFQEMARREALNAARVMVESKRLDSPKQDTLDLHGTTVSEAVIIVKEALETFGSSQAKPLKIITGRGLHSINQVSVLKPAVQKALVEDGWNVGSWDGGLIVRGRHGGG